MSVHPPRQFARFHIIFVDPKALSSPRRLQPGVGVLCVELRRRCPNRGPAMPILKQAEADRLQEQAVSPVQPGRHFSTCQMFEFKTKTRKLG